MTPIAWATCSAWTRGWVDDGTLLLDGDLNLLKGRHPHR